MDVSHKYQLSSFSYIFLKFWKFQNLRFAGFWRDFLRIFSKFWKFQNLRFAGFFSWFSRKFGNFKIYGCGIFLGSFLAVSWEWDLSHRGLPSESVNTGGERCNNRVATAAYTRAEGSGICIYIECGEPCRLGPEISFFFEGWPFLLGNRIIDGLAIVSTLGIMKRIPYYRFKNSREKNSLDATYYNFFIFQQNLIKL